MPSVGIARATRLVQWTARDPGSVQNYRGIYTGNLIHRRRSRALRVTPQSLESTFAVNAVGQRSKRAKLA